MGKTGVTAEMTERGHVKKWEQPCQTDIQAVVEAVKVVKQSLNEYLTQIINQSGDLRLNDKRELESSSLEDEEVDGDSVSGYIKNIAIGAEKPNSPEKRKVNKKTKAKRLKK